MDNRSPEPLPELAELGTQLTQRARPNKDFIVKSLRKATNALSQLEQSPQPRTTKEVQAAKKRDAALKPLADALSRGLLRHADKDVRFLVAVCVTELFRVKAPEPPFEDKHLREVFKLIISSFADLADTSSPYFSKRVKVLDTVAQLRCCVLMLEIDCIDLVLEMINIFFSVVRDDHHDGLVYSMSSIMLSILNESEEASQQLLEVILKNLIKGKMDATSAAYQLAASVIKTCAQGDELNPLVCRYLIACIHDRDAVGGDLKEFYHEIIFEVFQCAPQMLLAVIPSLIEELLADQVDVRIKAVNLVGKLFALHEQHVAHKYHDLFVEFLKRFSDKSVDVRIRALQCAKAFYVANPNGRESEEIITAVEDRLLDFDDRVRMQAVLVACDISRSNLKWVPSKLISQATERLWDKKISVRKGAMQNLIEVYQDYCKKCHEGSIPISAYLEEIPCKVIMLCHDKDCNEFRSQNMEFVLADNLFPEFLSVEERTKHWIHIFSHFGSLHEKALNTILTQKKRLQSEMKNYLAMRKESKGVGSEEAQQKIENVFKKMAVFFPDSHKAEQCLHNLNLIKDNSVFESIEQLLEKQTFTKRQAIRDELLVMIGHSNSHYDFILSLFSKCSNNIFSSDHVFCILKSLSCNESGTKHQEDCSVNLLLAIVRNFPSMLKGSEEQLEMLLKQTSPVNDKLIEIIARAGSFVSFNISVIYPTLKTMCLNGTRRQAKLAVSAIAALSSAQSLFLNLYKELLDSLYKEQNVATVLQSLGCIAQYSVSTFEIRDEEITWYICQKIIQVEHLDDGHDVAYLDDTSQCCEFYQLKIYGLKTLTKSYLPFKCNQIKRDINGLLDILSRILHEGDDFVSTDTSSCKNDKAHIRLAAAKAVLRLSRKWDLHITPEIFRYTILIAKHPSSFVRDTFICKINELLKKHKLPIRFACAFALGMTNGIEDLQNHNYKYMAEFIKDYSHVARKPRTSTFQGAIIDYPAYVVVFLIHVLAQNTEFPPEGCQDEKLYADLCSPLFFILQALVDPSIVDGDMYLVNDAVSYLFSIFRAIRKAEDAVDPQTTTKLHILAEIGMFALKGLKKGGISVLQTPQQIWLPSSLYKVRFAKNDGNSKYLKSLYGEDFLSRIFESRRLSFPQTYAHKPAKILPKYSRKGEEDVPKSINNICSVLSLASAKQNNLSRRTMTNSKSMSQDILFEKRRKHGPPSDSGSVSLHECSTVEKKKKLASRRCEKTSEKKMLSSCDSVSGKESVEESRLPTRRSKRAAACSLENDVTCIDHTAKYFKCPRTKLKDSCGSKKQHILADISNKSNFSFCNPGEHSSLSSMKESTTIGGLTAEEGASVHLKTANLGQASLIVGGKHTETSTSEVLNTNDAYAATPAVAVRTRRSRRV